MTQPEQRFVMQGARQIIDMAAGAIHIRQQVSAIEAAVVESPPFVFDLSKSLIDTVCKTILEDRGVKLDGKPDSPILLRETLKALKLHSDVVDVTGKTHDSLKKTANGLSTALTGICELRNTHGLISHGKDGFAPVLEAIQAQFVASAADAIVHILYRSHKGYGDGHKGARLFYRDYETENRKIDESYDNESIADFVKQYRPSELIFKMDIEAYRAAIDDLHNQDRE